MSKVFSESVTLPGPAPVRALFARPAGPPRRWPALVVWSDIFQHTGPHVRMVHRLAGHGFAVLAPELYARLLPPGTTLDFERDRQQALECSSRVELAWVDEERGAALAWLAAHPEVEPGRLGVAGWCFGGHLALRAALDPTVRAAACCYPTGLHSATLGAAQGTADTLARVGELRGEVLLVWGRADPHIPPEGRVRVHRALEDAGARFEARHYDAEHTFMRDEGARYDPAAAEEAFAAMLALFRRAL